MAKIEILESAQRELEAIAELHMNLVGPNSARKITDRILDSLSRLERFPLSGSLPRDAELLKSGYRYVIAGQYLCVYRLIVDTVFVYHIVHGASITRFVQTAAARRIEERRLTQSGLPERAGRFLDAGRSLQEKPERKPHGGSFRSGLFRIGKGMVQ